MDIVKIGKCKHYKGDLYEVLGVGKHCETLEDVVIYKALYDSVEFGNNALWTRPVKLFLGTVGDTNTERYKSIE